MTHDPAAPVPRPSRTGVRVNDKMRFFLIVVVSLGWVFNLVAPAFVSSYDSNLAANGPLLLILGSLFATRKPGKKSDD